MGGKNGIAIEGENLSILLGGGGGSGAGRDVFRTKTRRAVHFEHNFFCLGMVMVMKLFKKRWPCCPTRADSRRARAVSTSSRRGCALPASVSIAKLKLW